MATDDHKPGAVGAAEVVGGVLGGIGGGLVSPELSVVGAVGGQTAFGMLAERIGPWGRKNVDTVCELAIALSGLSRETVAEQVQSDLGKAQVMRAGIEAATRAIAEEKLRTLGAAMSSGLLAKDDAALNVEHMVIKALDAVEASHLQLLTYLSEGAEFVNRGAGPAQLQASELRLADLTGESPRAVRDGLGLPHLAIGMESLLATLRAHGLVEVVRPDWGGALQMIAKQEGPSSFAPPKGHDSWRITVFGIEFCDRVRNAAPLPSSHLG